jgi:hypothetical protein
MEFAIGSLIIRAANAIVWSVVLLRIFQHNRPVSPTARKLISVVIIGGVWVLVLGALIPFDLFDGDLARVVYTAYTAVTLIIGITLAMEKGGP